MGSHQNREQARWKRLPSASRDPRREVLKTAYPKEYLRAKVSDLSDAFSEAINGAIVPVPKDHTLRHNLMMVSKSSHDQMTRR